jgi:6-phosphogluconolactonase
MAKAALLDRLEAGPAAVHRIRGELPAEQAAEEYERELPAAPFDLLLLGIGPDAHTASLYPGSPALAERDRRVVAAEARLEPFVERVTLTLPALANTRALVFLAAGADKADAVVRAFGGDPSATAPSSLVRSAHGRTIAILDRAAAARLDL